MHGYFLRYIHSPLIRVLVEGGDVVKFVTSRATKTLEKLENHESVPAVGDCLTFPQIFEIVLPFFEAIQTE